MRKGLVVLLCLGMVASGASASVVPKNMTINLNLNLGGIFGGSEEEKTQEPENNTYGKRVGGQSVHTETRDNSPEEQRNTDDLKITNDQEGGKDPLIDFLSGLFGN